MWNYNDPYLCHYGVLGMRWGHHKRQDKSSGKAESSKSDKSDKSFDKSRFSKQDVDEYRNNQLKQHSFEKSKQSRYTQLSDEAILAEMERRENTKRTIIAAAAVIGIGAATYYAYKNTAIRNIIDNGSKNALKQKGGGVSKWRNLLARD